MIRHGWLAVFAAVLTLLSLSHGDAAGAGSERRVALVIGNGAYESAPLKNAVNDAEDVAAALTEMGFEVFKIVNSPRLEMRAAVRDFGDRIKGGGVGLFFYAGHGIQVQGINYLVPIDAQVRREDEAPDECLDVGAVLRKMEVAKNGINIIILDACRNNPFARGWQTTTVGLAKMDAPTGSLLAYATAPGSVASDGPGRNGLYTSVLLEYMREPGTEILDMFRKVRVKVMAETGGVQVPWESTSLTGEFFFVPPPPGGLPGETTRSPGTASPMGDWRYDFREDDKDLYVLWSFGPEGKGVAEGTDANDDWWAEPIEWLIDERMLTVSHPDKKNSYRILALDDREMTLKYDSGDREGDVMTMTRQPDRSAEIDAKAILGAWRNTWLEDGREAQVVYTFEAEGQGAEEGQVGEDVWTDRFRWRLENGFIKLESEDRTWQYQVRNISEKQLNLVSVGGEEDGQGFRLTRIER